MSVKIRHKVSIIVIFCFAVVYMKIKNKTTVTN